MTFVTEQGTRTTLCLSCGARIGPTVADKVEHLTMPSRAAAYQHRQPKAKKVRKP